MTDEKYMVYVNPYVEPEYFSGGWLIKLRDNDGSSDDFWDYALDGILRRAALRNGVYSTMKEAKKLLIGQRNRKLSFFQKLFLSLKKNFTIYVKGKRT